MIFGNVTVGKFAKSRRLTFNVNFDKILIGKSRKHCWLICKQTSTRFAAYDVSKTEHLYMSTLPTLSYLNGENEIFLSKRRSETDYKHTHYLKTTEGTQDIVVWTIRLYLANMTSPHGTCITVFANLLHSINTYQCRLLKVD